MPKKHKIFTTSGQYGIKRSGKWGKLSSVERAELNIQKGLYDNPRKITAQMKKDLDNLLKETAKRVNESLFALREYEKATGRQSPSIMPDIEYPKDIQDKIAEITRGIVFENEETSTVSGTEEFFDTVGDDFEDFFEDVDFQTGGEYKSKPDRDRIIRRILDMMPEKSSSEVADMVDYVIYSTGGIMDDDEITIAVVEMLQGETKRRNNFEQNAETFR